MSAFARLSTSLTPSDDTCAQPGYFQTIATFISSVIRPEGAAPSALSSPTSPVRPLSAVSTAPSSTDGSFELIDDVSEEGELVSALSTADIGGIVKEGVREKAHDLGEKLEKL